MSNRAKLIIGLVVGGFILVIGTFTLIRASLPNSNQTSSSGDVGSVLSSLNSIPPSTYQKVGLGSASNTIKQTQDPILKDQSGKPEILYVGGEFCPYCAIERWAIYLALSRFGSFSNLSLSSSAAGDIYPNTPTFSFHGSKYQSNYLIFTAVEHFGNIPQSGGGYNILEQLTSDQQNQLNKYDYPPYTSSRGSIPFMNFADHYILAGSTASPANLQGLNWDQVANSLKDPSTSQARDIIGSANIITAALCGVSDGNPTNICSQAYIRSISFTSAGK